MKNALCFFDSRLSLAVGGLAATMLIAVLLALPGRVLAQPSTLLLGQHLPDVALKDQHDKPWRIELSTRLVMFSASRKASKITQAVLATLPADHMTHRDALYLVDLSAMPGFITRNIALPALQKLPYLMGVSLNEATLAAWPHQADAVTLIELDRGLVKRISYASTEAEVRAALE
jgi:hypothetical protein